MRNLINFSILFTYKNGMNRINPIIKAQSQPPHQKRESETEADKETEKDCKGLRKSFKD